MDKSVDNLWISTPLIHSKLEYGRFIHTRPQFVPKVIHKQTMVKGFVNARVSGVIPVIPSTTNNNNKFYKFNK